MYYIVSDSRYNDELTLFLVDRAKTKQKWWSDSILFAKSFKTKDQANKALERLKYNDPRVVELNEAKAIDSENTAIITENSIHPFSSEGLGQW